MESHRCSVARSLIESGSTPEGVTRAARECLEQQCADQAHR
jgi:hypothetical protein